MGAHPTEPPPLSFGPWLRRYRLRANLKQRELAKLAGFSPDSISALECGTRRPSARTVDRLADALHLTQPERDGLLSLLHGIRPQPDTAVSGLRAEDIPATGSFYGREHELEQLAGWIEDERCRAILLLGNGGQGKTALAARLAERIHASFERVIWLLLTSAPSVESTLLDCLRKLNGPEALPTGAHEDQLRSLLLAQLRARRCLIVLDNLESVMESGRSVGRFRGGYDGYERLIETLSTAQQASCLVVTSRDMPRVLEHSQGDSPPVQVLRLDGLDLNAGLRLLSEQGLQGSPRAQASLIARYRGHPLALRVASGVVRKLFDGQLDRFLESGSSALGDLRELLDQQFARLTPEERQVLLWLAIEREPVSPEVLRTDLIAAPSLGEVLDLLELLLRRALVEVPRPALVGLHPVVLEYLTDHLVSTAAREIRSGQCTLLACHAMLKAQASDDVRSSQEIFLVGPLLESLTIALGAEGLRLRLAEMLEAQRARPPAEVGYLAGNLLNLLVYLGADLRGLDASNLVLRQAFLRDVELMDADFSGANVETSVFGDAFGEVLALAYAPRTLRPLLAAGTVSGEIHLWDTTSGTLVRTLRGHKGWVGAIAFSPDGKFLASGGDDGTVRVWELEQGEMLAVLRGHDNRVRAVGFHPEGELLVSGGGDGALRVWQVGTWAPRSVLRGHAKPIRALAFTRTGNLLATGADDGMICLWKLPVTTPLARLDRHRGWVRALAFSPDGALLFSAGGDGRIRLWKVTTGDQVRAWLAGGTARSLAVSGDGGEVVSGQEDGTVRWWDSERGRMRREVLGHRDRVRALAFSPDGLHLASGGDDQTIRIWDARAGTPRAQLTGYSGSIWSLGQDHTGRWVASACQKRALCVYEVNGDELRRLPVNHRANITCTAISPDGAWLLAGSEDGIARIYTLPSGMPRAAFRTPGGALRTSAFTADASLVATVADDWSVRVWRVDDGALLHDLPGGESPAHALAFSPDGCCLAVGGDDATVRLWTFAGGSDARVLAGHDDRVRAVAFSSDGTLVASGSTDATVRIWQTASGECLHALRGHRDWVRTVAFSPDGQRIATAGDDQTIRLWTLGHERADSVLEGHSGRIRVLAFAKDGQTLVSGAEDGTIRLWDGRTGAARIVLRAARPCERMRITGVQGLTEAQRRALWALGAVEERDETDESADGDLPSMRKTPLQVGVVGHRDLGSAETSAFVRAEAARHFKRWRAMHHPITVLSSLAVGADTLLAQVALRQGCELLAVVPFTGYEEEFGPDERAVYLNVRDQANGVIRLPATGRSVEAFRAAGDWIVDHSDVLLAVWDGLPARGTGGTAETVAYAAAQGKPVVRITVVRAPAPAARH